MSDARDTIIRLRTDAIDRGLTELALAYGWSAIRLGEELWAERRNAVLNNSKKSGGV